VDISPIDDLFPQHSHVHIFRIVQEAVSNVVKHSRASHARAVVAKVATSVQITVEDNGAGFSPEMLDAMRSTRNGFGLRGIRERARIFGGRVDIQSSAQTGTVLTVTLPLASTTHG
jgi:signal transduction histidine kinase